MNRLLVILMCLSLIGANALPAAVTNCCCKSPSKVAKQSGAECCLTGDGGSRSPRAIQPSCCSTTAKAPVAACCAVASLNKQCNTCQCVDQGQIVALPGILTCQVPEGASVLTAVERAPGSPIVQDRFTAPSMDHHPPGPAIILKTCTLLI